MASSTVKAQQDCDQLLLNIFNELSGELLHTVQSATQQILEMSANFLQDDVSDALQDFHALYEKNVELDTYKEAIAQNVDDIIQYIQNYEGDTSEIPDLSSIDNEQLAASRLSLSNLQKDMEGLARLDQGVKDKVIPILHNMQFEDQLSANVLIISDIWTFFINSLVKPDFDNALLLEQIYSQLNSAKLRQLFAQKVMRSKVSFELNIPEAVISSFVLSLNKNDSKEDFLNRMQAYCASVLEWNSDDAAASVSLIFDIITAIEQEAEQAGDFSAETHQAFSSLKQIAKGLNNPAKRESTKIMVALLNNRMSMNDSIQDLIKPVMVSMQFQDRIRQNMENLAKMMLIWMATRKRIMLSKKPLDDNTKQQIGLDLIDGMTMESERSIIKKYIPQLPSDAGSGADMDELF